MRASQETRKPAAKQKAHTKKLRRKNKTSPAGAMCWRLCVPITTSASVVQDRNVQLSQTTSGLLLDKVLVYSIFGETLVGVSRRTQECTEIRVYSRRWLGVALCGTQQKSSWVLAVNLKNPICSFQNFTQQSTLLWVPTKIRHARTYKEGIAARSTPTSFFNVHHRGVLSASFLLLYNTKCSFRSKGFAYRFFWFAGLQKGAHDNALRDGNRAGVAEDAAAGRQSRKNSHPSSYVGIRTQKC